ncbi:Testis-expressed protein 12 [Anabarilius grahami]|uniref:Testis-expressed protein 12 n=1 Tax=Anabarilius grahami TaxID=495550 RepID=A0A3N0Z496_ANAGA|nr:Testis-expressed protein 12 [Anabarilius grahami]
MLYHILLLSQETNDTARSREHQRGIHGGQRNRNEKMSSENTREANQEVGAIFSKYSEVLRERAAVDASQLGELEDILTEARSLKSLLNEKKEHLRRSLALISDKLQG